jgi:hypothetical protein
MPTIHRTPMMRCQTWHPPGPWPRWCRRPPPACVREVERGKQAEGSAMGRRGIGWWIPRFTAHSSHPCTPLWVTIRPCMGPTPRAASGDHTPGEGRRRARGVVGRGKGAADGSVVPWPRYICNPRNRLASSITSTHPTVASRMAAVFFSLSPSTEPMKSAGTLMGRVEGQHIIDRSP